MGELTDILAAVQEIQTIVFEIREKADDAKIHEELADIREMLGSQTFKIRSYEDEILGIMVGPEKAFKIRDKIRARDWHDDYHREMYWNNTPENQERQKEQELLLDHKLPERIGILEKGMNDVSAKLSELVEKLSPLEKAQADELDRKVPRDSSQMSVDISSLKPLLDEMNKQKELLSTQITNTKTAVTETKNAVATVDERVKNMTVILQEAANVMYRATEQEGWGKAAEAAYTRNRSNITIRGLR